MNSQVLSNCGLVVEDAPNLAVALVGKRDLLVVGVEVTQFVSKYERGDRRVDLIEFVAVCRALRVDPKETFALVLRRLPKSFDI